MLATLSLTSRASDTIYFFDNFETTNNWSTGSIHEQKPEIQLLQGAAAIISFAEKSSEQILEVAKYSPYSTVYLDASPFAASQNTYFEILTKPTAMDDSNDDEFLDFGGAILGFFKEGDHAQVHVLSSKNQKESVWITTGISYPIDGLSRPLDWIKIQIHIDHTTQRWALALDDEWVIKGLKALEIPTEVSLPLFLYGHSEYANQFDDILLANIHLNELEKALLEQGQNTHQKSQTTIVKDRFVSQAKDNSSLRHHTDTVDQLQSDEETSLKILNIHFEIDNGTRTFSASGGEKDDIISIYSPSYDENGNKKTVMMTVTADVLLEPGVSLRELKWEITEIIKWPDEFGPALLKGDFETGLVQQIPITAALQEMPTSVYVYRYVNP